MGPVAGLSTNNPKHEGKLANLACEDPTLAIIADGTSMNLKEAHACLDIIEARLFGPSPQPECSPMHTDPSGLFAQSNRNRDLSADVVHRLNVLVSRLGN